MIFFLRVLMTKIKTKKKSDSRKTTGMERNPEMDHGSSHGQSLRVLDGLQHRRSHLRYYDGHKGKFRNEFPEFVFRPDGMLRYANNSNYNNDTMIRKEAYVHKSVMEELEWIIVDSEIMLEDDSLWLQPDYVG